MVNVTFGELLEEQIQNDSIIPFENDAGLTKRDTAIELSLLSLAPNLLLVSSQADLEAEFGPDIIIPAGESWTVLVLNSFTLSKPYKGGSGSVLEIRGGSVNLTTTYDGTGALFQLETVGIPMANLILESTNFAGDNTNDIWDIEVSEAIVINGGVLFSNFAKIGTWKGSFFNINSAGFINISAGLILDDMAGGNFNGFSLNQTASTPPVTLITVLSPTKPTQIIANGLFSSDTNSSMLFLDPNSPIGSKATVTDLTGFYANVFRQGTDIAVTDASLGPSGVGFTEFGAVGHPYIVGQAVVNSGFSDSNYNGTFIITSIATDLYEVETPFGATGTGTVTEKSLDQTDVKVIGANNTDTPDSKSQSESLTATTIDLVPIISTFVPLEDDTPTPGDFIQDPATEEFTVDTSTGVVTYNGLITRDAEINYSCNVTKSSGGGTSTATISLFINVAQQTKTDRIAANYSTSATIEATYKGGLFTINPGDTFQLRIDADSVDPITASAHSLVIKV